MSNDNTAKPTAGPWKRDNLDNNCVITAGLVIGDIICLSPEEGGFSESAKNWEANAALIIEAGTVYHETGLTPRQLAEQRDELLAALKQLSADEHLDDDDPVLQQTRGKVLAIIAKVEAKP